MDIFLTYRLSKKSQYTYSISSVLIVATICYLMSDAIGYITVSLILLMLVSINAMLFDMIPVLIVAALSALIWNFFFIEPKYSFSIKETNDILLFCMYFIIALVNGVLTYKIRDLDRIAQVRIEREKSISLYNTLLQSLSHELRTPIATIIAASDTLQENDEKLPYNQRKDLLHEISKASLRLNNQVENLLNASRLEAGFLQPKLDWCDINEIVHNVLIQLKENSVYHHIRVDILPNLSLCKIDAGLLGQIIYNIVHNALLYTPLHTNIDIIVRLNNDMRGHFEPTEKEGIKAIRDQVLHTLHITIKDNGKGIPEAVLPYIFEKFYRVPAMQTKGLGLGLSIAQGFAQVLGGTIAVYNLTEGGVEFIINIPVEIMELHTLQYEQ